MAIQEISSCSGHYTSSPIFHKPFLAYFGATSEVRATEDYV